MLTTEQQDLISEVISRLEIRKKKCYVDKNPYYETAQAEWIDLTIKIKELNKLKDKK